MEPRGGKERVNGITMAFRHWPGPRRPSYPATVLLHGVLQTGAGMRHLAEQLALGGEVLVPDLRGRGDTEQPEKGYDPATMAEDVAALVERIDLTQAVLIGRLHGGLVAYHLAVHRPERVCGVVLGDTNPEVSPERAARALHEVKSLPRAFTSREEAERFYEENLSLPPERAQHDIPTDLESTPDGGYRWRHNLAIVERIEAEAMPRSDWGLLAHVNCPVLILRGQRGQIRAEAADRMLATIARARVQTIYGAGHDVFLGSGSEQAFAAVQLFLRGLYRGEF